MASEHEKPTEDELDMWWGSCLLQLLVSVEDEDTYTRKLEEDVEFRRMVRARDPVLAELIDQDCKVSAAIDAHIRKTYAAELATRARRRDEGDE